jgi:hypothetical protein
MSRYVECAVRHQAKRALLTCIDCHSKWALGGKHIVGGKPGPSMSHHDQQPVRITQRGEVGSGRAEHGEPQGVPELGDRGWHVRHRQPDLTDAEQVSATERCRRTRWLVVSGDQLENDAVGSGEVDKLGILGRSQVELVLAVPAQWCYPLLKPDLGLTKPISGDVNGAVVSAGMHRPLIEQKNRGTNLNLDDVAISPSWQAQDVAVKPPSLRRV